MSFLEKFLPEEWVKVEEITQQEPVPEPVVKQSQAKQRTINLSQSQNFQQPAVQPVKQPAYVPQASSFSAVSAAPDPEYLKYIDEFFAKENLEGIEYFELRTAVREMISSGTPAESAFHTIFIAYKAAGVTKEKLIETNQYYQGRFGTLKKDFVDDANSIIAAKETEFNKGSGLLNTTQENLLKEEEKLKARLLQIESERKTNEEALQKLQTAYTDVVNAQELRKTRMVTAIDYVVAIIADDEKSMQIYLK